MDCNTFSIISSFALGSLFIVSEVLGLIKQIQSNSILQLFYSCVNNLIITKDIHNLKEVLVLEPNTNNDEFLTFCLEAIHNKAALLSLLNLNKREYIIVWEEFSNNVCDCFDNVPTEIHHALKTVNLYETETFFHYSESKNDCREGIQRET